MTEPNTSPFEWILQHVYMIGWPLVVLLAWKLRGYFGHIVTRGQSLEAKIDILSTNHLPHIQESLTSIDKNLAVLVALNQRRD